VDQRSGVAMSCGVGRRSGSDPVLLWRWRRPPAVAPIRPLAWEPPFATGAALKRQKRPKKKKKKYKEGMNIPPPPPSRCQPPCPSRALLSGCLHGVYDLFTPLFPLKSQHTGTSLVFAFVFFSGPHPPPMEVPGSVKDPC